MREFWHGGAPGLEVGTILVPGNQVPGYSEIFAETPQEDLKALGQGWVYVTTDRGLARDFAAQNGTLFGAGCLYRVQPLEGLVPDPDYAHFPGVSYRVRRARVLAIEEQFDGTVSDPAGAALRYAMWEDGTRMYDDNGIPRPNSTHTELGVTAEDFLVLGRGASFSAIDELARRIVGQRNPGITQARIDVIRARHLDASRSR